MRSYDSNVLATVGLREPIDLVAQSIYSYYVPEEAATDDNSPYRESREGVPRRVELTFLSPKMSGIITGNDKDYGELVNNLDKVHSIEDIPNMPNTYLTIQDTGLLGRATDSIERSCRIRGITGNPTDKALSLSYSLSGSINTNTLQKLSVNYASLDLTFYTESKEAQSEKYTLARGLPVTALVYDKVVSDLCRNAESASPSRSPIAVGLIAKYLTKRQKEERSLAPQLSPDDFTSIMAPVSYAERLNNPASTSTSLTMVGYTVERVEESSSGERISQLIGVIKPGSDSRKFTDYNVKYGSRYSYTIRAVYSLQLPEILLQRYDSVTGKVLISSAPTNIATVTVEERVPPEPPTDLRFSYDYQKSLLMVRWSEPVDRTRDVTRYQLFRRTSLSEPFTLLKEFDFDQSAVKIERNETPLEVNISRSTSPVRRAFDYDFGKSSNYVYALCCVDAHGYVSNYSAQYSVTFEMRSNSLVVKCISPSGAPRPYPNLYVNLPGSLTLDTITRGGVSAMSFYFDPEYLTVTDRYDNDLKFLKYEQESAKYYMNLIDTTRAEQVVVPISIKDLRKTST